MSCDKTKLIHQENDFKSNNFDSVSEFYILLGRFDAIFQLSKLPGRTAVISKICTWFTKAYSGSSDINSIQKLVRGESFSA